MYPGFWRLLRTGILVVLNLALTSCVEPPSMVPNARVDRALVRLTLTALPMVSTGTQSPARGRCNAVILLPAEQIGPKNETLLALMEGHLMSGGLKVYSSAITGRVVSDPGHDQDEGAAKLSPLERALVLAKRSKADCIVELLTLDTNSEAGRYYLLPQNQTEMIEADESRFQTYPVDRRWLVTAEAWQIGAKVIDVETGAILGIIGLSASPLGRSQTFDLQLADGNLLPNGSSWTSTLNRREDIDYVRDLMMSELVEEIRGPK